jgi:2,3-diketo-5-methylthio-1-phosphopentane phosphatase
MGSVEVRRTRLKCHVFVDFDGTIVPHDVTDVLLERFAAPAWRNIEQQWQQGHIGSRECIARQVDLIRATPMELRRTISEISIDPGFAAFVRMCSRNGVGITIVSDGFDLVIEQVLQKAGLDLPAHANHLEATGKGRWRVTFPKAREDCAVLAGNCKCAFTRPYGEFAKVVIGDGLSDFCVAGRADLVFAKGKLLEQCRDNGLVHLPFTDFFEVSEQLGSWLQSRDRRNDPPELRSGQASS